MIYNSLLCILFFTSYTRPFLLLYQLILFIEHWLFKAFSCAVLGAYVCIFLWPHPYSQWGLLPLPGSVPRPPSPSPNTQVPLMGGQDIPGKEKAANISQICTFPTFLPQVASDGLKPKDIVLGAQIDLRCDSKKVQFNAVFFQQ